VGALERARALKTPIAAKTEKGEFEGAEFWEEHEELLKQAWQEFERLHPGLYRFDHSFEERYISKELRDAAKRARQDQGEAAALALFREELSPDVWASNQLFTDAFVQDMLEELEHIRHSGIPQRRPNGMNRYGSILDQVGFEPMLAELVRHYVRPLAQMLLPDTIGPGDAAEQYTFSVRYTVGEDVALPHHADASVATLNLCLGRGNWSGGTLRFFGDGQAHWGRRFGDKGSRRIDDRTQIGDVNFTAGLALLHRGQHKHQALDLLGGIRTNLIIWLMGDGGYVRVAPYPPDEQLTATQRWTL
jgi:hypothetical protein